MSSVRQLAELPADQVVRIEGAGAATVATAAGRARDDLAVLVLDPADHTTPGRFVRSMLDELERVAVALVPGWLPETVEIGAPTPAVVAAVRAAATRHAHGSPHFAPFLADLAATALSGRSAARQVFSPEIRSTGLARIVAEGFGHRRLVLLIPLPEDRTARAERAVVAGAAWFNHRTGTGVWLTGSALRAADQVPVVRVDVPGPDQPAGPWPAVSGRPHPASAVEAALEAALQAESWAVGRHWNWTYQPQPLAAPVRLDLVWPADRCVVELDGPEHCHPRHFEDDRQRDVLLQLDGYAVLRFTNARVRHDVGTVVHQIGTYLRNRRQAPVEGTRPWQTTS